MFVDSLAYFVDSLAGAQLSQSASGSLETWNGNILLGLLAWLIVISVILILLIVGFFRQSYNHKISRQNHMAELTQIFHSITNRIPYERFQDS